jgi:hypothetical protein
VSSEAFLIRFLLGLLGSMAAVLGALELAVSNGHAEGRVLGAGIDSGQWATAAELDWLGRLGAWDSRLLPGLQPTARLAATQTVALEPADSCATDLTANVGQPPTTRLERAYDTFLTACIHLIRFHVAIDRGSEIGKAQDEARRAAGLLLKADQLLPPGEVRTLPVIAGESAQSRVEPRFGHIASALAGKQVEVRCWSEGGWHRLMREETRYTHGKLGSGTLGFAGIGGTRVNLGPTVCGGLVALAYKRLRPSDEAGRLLLASAAVTLTHELQHSKGIAEESVAECNAIQLANETAIELGASPAYAAALVRTYWRHYAEELPAYRAVECRKGGKLDRGRSTSIWP